ncbi:MAG TPA: c-type cytochrome [Burkholderiales bacterium]|nr:c-type cytochrome [Burkholderiales bacterium]
MKALKLLPVAAFAFLPMAAHADMTGEQVFKNVCSMCHGTGMMGAPKFGDKAAWAPRIKQGEDTLVQHALHGIRQMPAKGGKTSLTDAEVKAAVHYMVSHAQ